MSSAAQRIARVLWYPLASGVTLCALASCEASAPQAHPTKASPPAAAAAAPSANKLEQPRPTLPTPPPSAAEPATDTAAASDAAPAILTGGKLAGTDLDEDVIVSELGSAQLLLFRPVGTTSTVFKTTLKAGIAGALKAPTQRKPNAPEAEVAAYRLARCLGVHSVPPAVFRSVPVTVLHAELVADRAADWAKIEPQLIVTEPLKLVRGALIYWIEGMRDPQLDDAAGEAKVATWLRDEQPLADADRPLAAQLSTMIGFDYLIGNWDRWSGGNVKTDATGAIVYLRDHDASFAVRVNEALHRRLVDRLVQTERFSRTFYAAVQALTRPQLEAELARDPGFALAKLDPRRIDAMFDRRETFLSHVSALIEERGEARVLVFP